MPAALADLFARADAAGHGAAVSGTAVSGTAGIADHRPRARAALVAAG
ncbi:hypothetical protein [Kribbella sp. NPDC048915]